MPYDIQQPASAAAEGTLPATGLRHDEKVHAYPLLTHPMLESIAHLIVILLSSCRSASQVWPGTRRISMTPRLSYPVFDGDNHMYETRDALTKFLPPEYHGAIRYVEVDGRTKIATLGQISDYIPNPTFNKVAAPGAQEDYFHNGNPEGK